MDLEIISHRPVGPAHRTPLLFVHGAYSGAWVWDEHFLPFFAKNGYQALALSLRGHGESGGQGALLTARLRDYATDVEAVLQTLSSPPVLIGHSMGGMVVQKLIHRHRLPGAVLMASAPPHGMFPSLFGMVLTNPALYFELALLQAFGPMVANGLAVRRALFANDTPDASVRRYMRRFQAESIAVVADLMGLDLPPSTPCLDLPVLVLGAENDGFVFRGGLDATADTYRTSAEVFPGMAHAMMLEHNWQSVAERILRWLTDLRNHGDATAARQRSVSSPSTAAQLPALRPTSNQFH